MRRREFIAGLGATVAWPSAARAQQGERVRRVPITSDENVLNDPVVKRSLSAFTQALAGLGWTDGRNVRIDPRGASPDTNQIRAFAQELVSLQPDIIVVSSTPAAVALQREKRTIPIVFVNVGDPVASGLVAALNRPGGNITGFDLSRVRVCASWWPDELRLKHRDHSVRRLDVQFPRHLVVGIGVDRIVRHYDAGVMRREV
jgi:putative tryptophan/tyrosine transport system substrate-binding protein